MKALILSILILGLVACGKEQINYELNSTDGATVVSFHYPAYSIQVNGALVETGTYLFEGTNTFSFLPENGQTYNCVEQNLNFQQHTFIMQCPSSAVKFNFSE